MVLQRAHIVGCKTAPVARVVAVAEAVLGVPVLLVDSFLGVREFAEDAAFW